MPLKLDVSGLKLGTSDLNHTILLSLPFSLNYFRIDGVPIDISITFCYRENLPNRATFLKWVRFKFAC